MKKIIFSSTALIAIIIASLFTTPSCNKDTWNKFWNETIDSLLNGKDVSNLFGWQADNENMNQIESSINLGAGSSLPAKIDLTKYFPPIGNQGSYGTCVAWAVAYNLRTYLDAKDGNYTPTTTSKQYSPKDLFWSVSSADKGANCNGTNFEPALDILISRGVASIGEVPYTEMGDCSKQPQSSWTSSAASHKIVNYRKIDIDLNTIKEFLSQGRPVVIGARLGDRFMAWDNSTPISSETYNNPGMQHAYHAMILGGYDDSKNAFRVVNTWDTNWGDHGFIWVDYNFFIKSFCFAAFVATNKTTVNPDNNNDNTVDPNQLKTGADLLAWEVTDYDDPASTDPTKRKIKYNVFNSGNQTISASKDWNIIYIYYNAYNANDYDVLLYDYYSNDFGKYGDNGSFDDIGKVGDGISDNWWNYIDAPAGKSLAQALYGKTDSRFNWGYYMPTKITGSYYLVLIADGYDAITEVDEENNYFFFTKANGDPVTVNKGVIDYSSPITKKSVIEKRPASYAKSPSPTTISERNVNAYSPAEIKQLIRYQKNTGELKKKVENYLKNKRKNDPKTEG